jgi:2-polyprenyl-3-methyl-5-hydroxy-6-metoxy-1,4-benzoquinol methylase
VSEKSTRTDLESRQFPQWNDITPPFIRISFGGAVWPWGNWPRPVQCEQGGFPKGRFLFMSVYEPVIAVMRKHQCTCSPEQFHAAVNVTFHEFEAEVYDREHKDMWDSVPKQVELLVGDWLAKCPQVPESLNVLDIGCGTGLASDSVLKSSVGRRVRSIDLLDTSKSMLRRVSERAASWPVPVRQFEGLLQILPAGQTYDVIVTSSVLHHVPDLASFLRTVGSMQRPGGVFLHVQDPNGDYMNDPELKRRMAEVAPKLPAWAQRLHPRRILGRVRREITGSQGSDFISKTIQALVSQGLIKEPLTVAELFAITEIHICDGSGISLRQLRGLLPDYDLLGQRSYGFFGQLPSRLPSRYVAREEQLIAAGVLNGFHIGAIWMVCR